MLKQPTPRDFVKDPRMRALGFQDKGLPFCKKVKVVSNGCPKREPIKPVAKYVPFVTNAPFP